ncbi:HAD-IIIA family hydrolase [Opitutaceae bacterium TAV3]|nr:HAD-IIIA family hydrolase [Opitutaceae bacterium TAV3]
MIPSSPPPPPPTPAASHRTKALILDRDGTLIEHVPYLHKPDDIRLLPGVAAALRAAQHAGIQLFLHTNQSGVARGMFNLDAVHACNDRLIALLDLGPRPFERICIAPEGPDAPLDSPNVYRKPSPRFAHEIMHDYQLQPHEICYIGDRGSDLATAHAAGTRGVGVATGLDDLHAELAALSLDKIYPIFPTLAAALHHEGVPLDPGAATRVFTLDALVERRRRLAAEGRRLVLTNGVFDLLHRGHLEYLQKSAQLGDELWIAVNSDDSVRRLKGPDRPLNNEHDRAFALASLRSVDAIFIFPGPRLADEIRALRPDIYTKAGDYTRETLDPSEREALLETRAQIIFQPFIAGRSTTSLIQRMRLPETPAAAAAASTTTQSRQQ